MRLVLIYPHAQASSPLWMPLGLAFAAAELRRAGHSVAIFDRFASQFQHDLDVARVDAAMLEQIKQFQPDLIGLSTVSPLIYDTVESASLIRQTYSGLMVAGGYHATALPELTLEKIPALDGVLTGEGEHALTHLANGNAPRTIPGLWWRAQGRISPPASPSVQIANLDELELPALDLMDMPLYTDRTDGVIRRHNRRAATLVTSRGCYAHCTFCAESLTYGRGIRWHSAPYVLEWVRCVMRDYDVDGLHFHDNDWLANEARAREICEAFIRQNWHRRLTWSIQARADRLTPDLARLLKSAGCCLVEIGIEVGTQEELNRIGKGTRVDTNNSAVRMCRQAGMDVHAYMMTQLPGETIADLERRLVWLKHNPVTSFQWSPLNIHPGTVMYAKHGGNFFAEHAWTAPSIMGYYLRDTVSAIPPETRRAWMAKNFGPFLRWHWWRNAIGRYPISVLARLAWLKVRRRLARILPHRSLAPAK